MSLRPYSITANIKSLYHTALFCASFLGNKKKTRCKSVICSLLFRIFLAVTVTNVLEGLQTRKQTR
jgi:hypothetical protein